MKGGFLMKRSMTALLGLVMLLSIGTLMAQSASYISGTVVSSTDTTLVIRTDSGEEMTFNVDSATIRPTSMAVGSRIDVEYHAADGANHAAQVRLVGSATTTAANSNEKLPQTASPLVTIGLVGLAALGSSFVLRQWSRRRSAAGFRH